MQTITVELTNPHTFKIIKELEAAQLLKIKPTFKAKKLSKKQQNIVTGLKEALHEVDLYMDGKIELQTARDFLHEL